MFKMGDIVEMTAEAAAIGMLDFKDGKGYKVLDSNSEVCGDGFTWRAIKLENESGVGDWYGVGHFKLKEETVVEKKECLFKEGQVVWDTSYGRGVVCAVFPPSQTTSGQVQVEFDSTKGSKVWYTLDGKYQLEKGATHRTLFFSEPKIEAATEPVFEPTLKEGDIVVVKHVKQDWKHLLQVRFEDEDAVWVSGEEDGYLKSAWNFYKLGEKINFK